MISLDLSQQYVFSHFFGIESKKQTAIGVETIRSVSLTLWTLAGLVMWILGGFDF